MSILVDPGTGDSAEPVATKTLTVDAVAGIEVPYGIPGYASAGVLVPVDSTHGLPVSVLNTTIAVTGTFWQATQPVSAASLPLPTGAATEANQATELGYLATIAGAAGVVSVSNFPSGFTVSGTVAVSNLPGTQPVSGTFWQATQPVSGTFWQATQPVSAAALPLPSGAATESTLSTLNGKVTAVNTGAVVLAAGSAVIGHVVVDTAPTTAVTGTFWQATQPVSIATAPALVAGTAVIGYVNAIQAGDTIEIAGTTYTVKNAFANATASGETTVVAAVSAKKIRVLAYSVGPVSAAVNIYFDNATDGARCSTKYLAANGGMGRSVNPFGHFTTGTNNEALRINLSTTANVGVDLLYIEV